MSDPLASLARHVENDPLFLASVLRLYALSEHLDDAGLAEKLRCSLENLTMIRLCQSPRPDPQTFRDDITAIAERFEADKQQLAIAVRQGQSLQQARGSQTEQGGSLLAARDHQPEPPPEEP